MAYPINDVSTVELDGRSIPEPVINGGGNKLSPHDRAAHDWYRFVLSFPPHLVREYLARFGVTSGGIVLDPFCGTGTTLVECKKLGANSIGIEANPMPHFASQVKVDWTPDPGELQAHAEEIAEAAMAELQAAGMQENPLLCMETRAEYSITRSLPDEQMALLLKNSISPQPLHKTIVLLDWIRRRHDPRYSRHETLALAKALVTSIGNLHFGPEVGVRTIKKDANVVPDWLTTVRAIADDLRTLRSRANVTANAYQADARAIGDIVQECSVDAVITSPPYPNEKDYTRTTRLESVILGFIRDKTDLRALKKELVRSNTRGVYKADTDDAWAAKFPEVQRIADAIEARRVELGKTSGFERLYARVTRLYFGGMARHLAQLRPILKPGAHLAYVVGDQASYLRVMIRTGNILADIAESLGYELVSIDLFRTRLATATKEQLREEVVVLRWPGPTAIAN